MANLIPSELPVKVCKALNLDPDRVSRLILDFNACEPGPMIVYIQYYAGNKLLEVDWSALKGVEVKTVDR